MKNKKSIIAWVFTPFKFIAGTKAFLLGGITMLILSVLGYLSDTHLDGALDIHYGCSEISKPYTLHLSYQLTGWLSLSVVFYITARIVSKSSFRLIDLAGTLALAKIPLILAVSVGFIPSFHICFGDLNTQNIATMITILQDNVLQLFTISAIAIIISVWYIVLMYNAYSISTNTKGVIGVISFIIALIIAEILSKVILYFLW